MSGLLQPVGASLSGINDVFPSTPRKTADIEAALQELDGQLRPLKGAHHRVSCNRCSSSLVPVPSTAAEVPRCPSGCESSMRVWHLSHWHIVPSFGDTPERTMEAMRPSKAYAQAGSHKPGP